jgi:predicted acetyltransferase
MPGAGSAKGNLSTRAKNPPGSIEVVRATVEQMPIVANLLELYIHDFSEFFDVELGEDGRFGYPHLPLYWHEANRHPFLVRIDGKLAGLVLVKQGSVFSGDPAVWDMAEFFVARAYRRRGVGTRIAHEVWRRFPGRWEIRVMEANAMACGFWQHAVSEFAGDAMVSSRIESNGRSWQLFSFESGPVA